MMQLEGGIIVGVLGQWASGKSTAAETLVRHLGGEGKVVFLTDFVTFGRQAVEHLLELGDARVKLGIEEDGGQWLEGEQASVWLRPEEDLSTVDFNTLRFWVDDELIPAWLDKARVELGHQICGRSAEAKPIVVEAGFGQHPVGHTVAELFAALERAGVGPEQVRWIIVEAGYDVRLERNENRRYGPPADVFVKYAADGGDLEPDQQTRLEERGARITRVSNDHNDINRFRTDIIAAFEGMFRGV